MSCKALRNAPLHVLLQASNINAGPAVCWAVGGGGTRKSVVHKTDKSLPSAHWQHRSRQTRKPATETEVHGTRGNNPSFLCPSPSSFMGVRIISSWLSSVFFPDTRNYIFIRKTDAQGSVLLELTFWQDCLLFLGTLHWSFQLCCLT